MSTITLVGVIYNWTRYYVQFIVPHCVRTKHKQIRSESKVVNRRDAWRLVTWHLKRNKLKHSKSTRKPFSIVANTQWVGPRVMKGCYDWLVDSSLHMYTALSGGGGEGGGDAVYGREQYQLCRYHTYRQQQPKYMSRVHGLGGHVGNYTPKWCNVMWRNQYLHRALKCKSVL